MDLVGHLMAGASNMSLSEMDRIMDEMMSGRPTASGVPVTPANALGSVAVLACVKLLTETLSSLPLVTYERTPDDGKRRAIDHPLYQLLDLEPNGEMTAREYRETLVGHVALRGEHFSEIQRDAYTGDPIALWPLRVDKMDVARDAQRRLIYDYTLPDQSHKLFARENILHIRSFSQNGLRGQSVIQLAQQAVGLSIATEEYAARFFGNGSLPGGVITHPKTVTDKAAERMIRSWEDMHKGLHNSQRIAILEEGVSYQSIGITPEESQFLESRRYQLEEIARLYRIPPHMLGDLTGSTSWGTGIEQQSIGFVVYTILPWTRLIEQRMHISLFDRSERGRYFPEHLIDGLLRGDIKSRYDAYAVGRQNGWLSANDIRRMENMNPIPGGDVYMVNGNMIPVDQVAQRQLAAAIGVPELMAAGSNGKVHQGAL